MDLKQIFLLALCLVPACTWTCMHRCCDQTELEEAAQKKLRVRIPQPLEPSPAPHSLPASCPLDLYQRLAEDIKDRSLSPWRYMTEQNQNFNLQDFLCPGCSKKLQIFPRVTDQDYFPSTYMEAQCLCEGCIMMLKNGSVVENHDYNSSPVLQSRGFLKRARSGCQEGKYRLKVEYRQVAVGCTCVTAFSVPT